MSNQRTSFNHALLAFGAAITFGVPALASAQAALDESCTNIEKYYKDGDVDGALEEAQWCVQALQKIKQGKEGAFFKEQIGDWKRAKLDQNQALGMAVTEADYQKGDKTIQVSLIGNAGAGNGGIGALIGSFAQAGLAAAAGNHSRIQRHSAITTTENGTTTIMVTLESGGSLQFQSSDASADEITAFANLFPITELDQSRK